MNPCVSAEREKREEGRGERRRGEREKEKEKKVSRCLHVDAEHILLREPALRLLLGVVARADFGVDRIVSTGIDVVVADAGKEGGRPGTAAADGCSRPSVAAATAARAANADIPGVDMATAAISGVVGVGVEGGVGKCVCAVSSLARLCFRHRPLDCAYEGHPDSTHFFLGFGDAKREAPAASAGAAAEAEAADALPLELGDAETNAAESGGSAAVGTCAGPATLLAGPSDLPGGGLCSASCPSIPRCVANFSKKTEALQLTLPLTLQLTLPLTL